MWERITPCVKETLPVAFKTSVWFLKIMLPVSFIVMLLSWFNILPYLSAFAAPLFVKLGLPGDAALVFVTSIFTNVYTVIALLANLDFTVRESLILAVMCLVSHNIIVETLVQKKCGSSAFVMVVLRISVSFVAAFLLNICLPEITGNIVNQPVALAGFLETFLDWLKSSLLLSVKIVVIISLLMIFQRMLKEFGVLKFLSRWLAPLMDVFGLPRPTAFLWLVGNTLGLAYGSAVLMDEVKGGKITPREADLLNWHLAVSHSLLEDPLLFAVIGLPWLWLIIPRLILAAMVVWGNRLWYALRAEKMIKIKA